MQIAITLARSPSLGLFTISPCFLFEISTSGANVTWTSLRNEILVYMIKINFRQEGTGIKCISFPFHSHFAPAERRPRQDQQAHEATLFKSHKFSNLKKKKIGDSTVCKGAYTQQSIELPIAGPGK